MACRVPLARVPRQAFRPVCAPRRPTRSYSYASALKSPQSSKNLIPPVPFKFERPTTSDVHLALDFARGHTLDAPFYPEPSRTSHPNPNWLPNKVSLAAWPLFRCFANYDSWLIPSFFSDHDFSWYGLQDGPRSKGLHIFSTEERYNKWIAVNKAPDVPFDIKPTPLSGLRFLSAAFVLPVCIDV